MKAVILAGGKGSRISQLSGNLPKSMLKIGNKPILEHQIDLLKKYNIREIYIIVASNQSSVFSNDLRLTTKDLRLIYYEEKEPLGTVGGIKELEEHLKEEDFLVLYGDVMINMNLERFIKFHKEMKSECSLVLHPNNHPYDSDLVEIDNKNRITAFYPKPHNKYQVSGTQYSYYRNLVSAGVYIFNPIVLKYLIKGKKADFGRDIFPTLISKQSTVDCQPLTCKMYGYNTSEYLKDMGTPERYEEVQKDFAGGKFHKMNYENKQKAIFMDRDGVIIKEKNFICKPEQMELFDFSADAVKMINDSDYLGIIATNQSVVARNLCNIEDVNNIHNKLETELGEKGAKLDRIYFCPHHPDKGYPEENKEYKIECDCRKPKIGMFIKAANDYNLDASSCFMIGDSERDIMFGKNAGMQSIGVMTGYGLKKSNILPDYFFRDLKQSVKFIINDPYFKYFNEIFEKVLSNSSSLTLNTSTLNTPYVIAIGGNSRTGKSNFTNYLKNKFIKKGLKVLVIELDKWIIHKNERKGDDDVYKRFRSDKIITDFDDLFIKNKKIYVEGYSHHPDRETIPIEYKLQNENIVIIEGVISLSLEEIRKYSHLKIFFKIDRKTLKNRVYEFYLWKNYKKEDIDALYKQRLEDEYKIIEKDVIFADYIINDLEI